MNGQIRRAEWGKKVSPRFENRIQWKDRLPEEKPNWNDVENGNINKLKQNSVESLTKRMDHVKNRESGLKDKVEELGQTVKFNERNERELWDVMKGPNL